MERGKKLKLNGECQATYSLVSQNIISQLILKTNRIFCVNQQETFNTDNGSNS